jgi:hypothetical protein
MPNLDDDGNKKESIRYTIFSFPVASTFTPSKGKAEGVDKAKQAACLALLCAWVWYYRVLNGELL